MSVEGRYGCAGGDKELLTNTVISTLLATTEGVLISVRVVTGQAVRIQRKRCVTLLSSNCEHLTLLATRKDLQCPLYSQRTLWLYIIEQWILEEHLIIFRVLFHVHKNTSIFLFLKSASWTETASDFPHPSSYFITETLIKTQFPPINKYVWCSIEVLCNTCRTMESDSRINYYQNNLERRACLWMLAGRCDAGVRWESRMSNKAHE